MQSVAGQGHALHERWPHVPGARGGDVFDVPKGEYCQGRRPNSTYEIQGKEVVLELRDRTVVRFPFTVDKQFLTIEGSSFYGENVRYKRVAVSSELLPNC